MELENKVDINKDYSGNQFGKYYLIEKLGNGGFGAVYRAHDQILGVEKAIKILEVSNPNEAYKLFSEASIPYKCQHANIVKINSGEIIDFNGEFVFVVDMELANGKSVDSTLKTGFISTNESLDIIRNILFAVEYSHIQGIIHRDIKPANILLDKGVPKLADFGLSTALGTVIVPWKWYVTHAAPETFVNDSIATVQTDIFAIGMTLYRMVTGISDWNLFIQSIPNAQSLMKNGRLINNLPLASYVPDKVYKIIKKACHADPQKRYKTASDMRNAIEKLSPQYDWRRMNDFYWVGNAMGQSQKEINLELKKSVINVVVRNNGRKSSKDSEKFSDLDGAKKYMFEYIKGTTLK